MPRSPPNILEHVSKMFWCIFGTFTGTLPGKSRTKNIVKGNVYLDDLDLNGSDITGTGNINIAGDIRATGDIIAERYVVSSSVSHFTQSFSSGSTLFGDTADDTHQFTGSLSITGDMGNNISGSSSSTGSFGELHIDDKISIGTTISDKILTVSDTNNSASLSLIRNDSAIQDGEGIVCHFRWCNC